MQEEDPTRREKIKRHLRENKKVYLVGAGCFIAGGLIFRGGPEFQQIIQSKQIGYKSTQTMTTIMMQAKGDPGDVIMRMSDGKKWPSKGELARDLGVHRTTVTRYFKGDLPNILDEQYKVIGKAGHEIHV